jgi:hypothetical protein
LAEGQFAPGIAPLSQHRERGKRPSAKSAEPTAELRLHGPVWPAGDSPNLARRDRRAFTRAQTGETLMDKTNDLFLNTAENPESAFGNTSSDSKVYIADKRMARLLLVLHELDKSVAGLEELPQPELTELVSSAIMACGFVDGTEARYAIAAVLETIEMGDLVPGRPYLLQA